MTKTSKGDVVQATLSEPVAGLTADDEVVIMKNHQPIAKLATAPPTPMPRVPGMMTGKLTVIAEDNEHLRGFEGYMP